MQKKRRKKSWRKHNDRPCCNCFVCSGGRWLERLIQRTRVRRKYFKYPNKTFEEV